MSKKDEARAALFQRLFDWESEKPGLAAFAAFEKVEAALDAYGAACAEAYKAEDGSADALTAVVLAWDALKQGSITAEQYEATVEAVRPKWTAQEIEAAKIKAADMATKLGEQPEKEPQR